MKQLNIFFDVDGTLIWPEGIPNELPDTPRYEVIQLFHAFERLGCRMFIWSGGGCDYAIRWRDRLGLKASVITKGAVDPDIIDIAVDDEEVKLGIVNIKV